MLPLFIMWARLFDFIALYNYILWQFGFFYNGNHITHVWFVETERGKEIMKALVHLCIGILWQFGLLYNNNHIIHVWFVTRKKMNINHLKKGGVKCCIERYFFCKIMKLLRP